MKLEDQVVSLKLSGKLKELGIKQESYFYWWADAFGLPHHRSQVLEKGKPNNPKSGWSVYSAFMVAELGEILPESITAERGGFNDVCNLVCTKIKDEWWVTYDSIALGIFIELDGEKTEADARAKMLIYLKENNLI